MSSFSYCNPNATHNPGDCIICDFYHARLQSKAYQFPHCDAFVTHAPKNCTYCDDYASDIQTWRIDNSINFTGETDPNKLPCPATVRRKPDAIHRWYGNAPQPKCCKRCGKKAVYINLALACPDHGLV